MMTPEQKEKLDDYLMGFQDMKSEAITPVGAVLVDEEDREEILSVIEKTTGAKAIKITEDTDELKSNNTFLLLDLKSTMHPKMANLLVNAARGKDLNIKILMLQSATYFDSDKYSNKLAASVCRL